MLINDILPEFKIIGTLFRVMKGCRNYKLLLVHDIYNIPT